jgi:uridine phosphorylase
VTSDDRRSPTIPTQLDLRGEYPILEFDDASEALLEPAKLIKRKDVPEYAVACFFADVLGGLVERGAARVIAHLRSEIGRNPIYEIEVNGQRLAVFHPGVGAPLAAAFLEEMIALGSRKFMACGGAGVLASEIAVGHPIVVNSAVRDEGTSYHYLPPGREVAADPRGIAALEETLRAAGVEYLIGKTWTTDAVYRETPAKIARRRAEGCICVEMEAAAFCAVACFRGVHFGQLLYGGDDVGGEAWDSRHWETHGSVRERLFWLSAEACLRL